MTDLQSNAETKLIYCSDKIMFFLLASLNNTYSLHMYINMYVAYFNAIFYFYFILVWDFHEHYNKKHVQIPSWYFFSRQ